jgi:hypothetical protein
MAAQSFFMDYGDLEDNNFNSWNTVERYDQYVSTSTPRIVGADGQGPILQTADRSAWANDIDTAFLHLDATNTSLSVTSVQATAVADGDSIYTPDTVANYDTAGGDVTLSHVFGYDPDGAGAITAQASNALAVLKLNVSDATIADAFAYVYRPAVETTDAYNNAAAGTTIVLTDGIANETPASGTSSLAAVASGEVRMRDNDANNGSNDTLVVELPTIAGGVSNGDHLVIQNVLVDDVYYTIMVNAPAAVANTTAPATTEALLIANSLPTINIYKQVYLDTANAAADFSNLRTSTDFGGALGPYSFTGALNYRERVTNPVVTWNTLGTDNNGTNTTDELVTFVNGTSGTVVTTGAGATPQQVDFTLNAVTAGSVNEVTTQTVGNDAVLKIETSDFSGQSSIVNIQLQKGHGATGVDTDNGGAVQSDQSVILNIISGSAID